MATTSTDRLSRPSLVDIDQAPFFHSQHFSFHKWSTRRQWPTVCHPDVWAWAILFLGVKDAVRTRQVSRDMGVAFDRACWIGPAPAAQLGWPFVFSCAFFAERVCQSVRRANDGPAPLWLRYIRRDVLLAALACGGLAEACGALVRCPFSFGPDEARSNDNFALRCAAENGHVAVLDRLAAPPYNLGQADARSDNNYTLRWAAACGHVAALDRLAAPPYNLGHADARGSDNFALHWAAKNGHVAVVDRLAAPPYNLGQVDARSDNSCALRWASRNGHVAVLDRLAAPPYNLGHTDAIRDDNYALQWASQKGHVAVLDRLAAPPYSL